MKNTNQSGQSYLPFIPGPDSVCCKVNCQQAHFFFSRQSSSQSQHIIKLVSKRNKHAVYLVFLNPNTRNNYLPENVYYDVFTCVNLHIALRKPECRIFNILWIVFVKRVYARYREIFLSIGNIRNSIKFSSWFEFVIHADIPLEVKKVYF